VPYVIFSLDDCDPVCMTSQTFPESRQAQLVKALQSVEPEQVNPIKQKSEAELDAERSAAATALSAVYLRERELRYGKRTL
jgi:hypothetical protein